MLTKCTLCGIDTEDFYIIDHLGQMFCNEECRENYYEHTIDEKGDPEDHPYHHDYYVVRQEYINYLRTWERELEKKDSNQEWLAEEMIVGINQFVDQFNQYIRLEGQDGPYSMEIYNYIKKFVDLEEQIFRWRPPERVLFSSIWIEIDENEVNKIMDPLANTLKDNHKEKLLSDIYSIQHLSGYTDIIFYSDDVRDKVYGYLTPILDGLELKHDIDELYKCDGCDDCLEFENDYYWKDGWFYCEHCENDWFVGILDKKELLDDIERIESDEDLQPSKINEFCLRKIQRSCWKHKISVPDWANVTDF